MGKKEWAMNKKQKYKNVMNNSFSISSLLSVAYWDEYMRSISILFIFSLSLYV